MVGSASCERHKDGVRVNDATKGDFCKVDGTIVKKCAIANTTECVELPGNVCDV